MMALLKKIPLFPVLLVLFFCLHGWLENYGFIRPAEVVYPGIIIAAAVILLTCLVFLFTRNLLFACLVVFFISLWYLFFGALHDAVKSIPFAGFLKSYSVLLPLIFLLTIAFVFFLSKNKQLHGRLAFYLNILLLIYCLVDTFLLMKIRMNEKPVPAFSLSGFNNNNVKPKPDVYLLLFDGYPGYTSLKDSFDFDNDSLRHYLAARSFTSLPVVSNYDLTYFSMSALFNMNYIKDDFDNMNLTGRDFQKRGVEINRGAVFSAFRSMGYDIKNLSVFEVDDQPPVSDKNSFLLAHSVLLTDKILHNRLKRDIGGRLSRFIPFWKNDDFYQHSKNNALTEEMLIKTAVQKRDKPMFTYAHFMMPHGPYYFDSLGNKNPYDSISHFTMWQNKPLFVSYVKYVNSRIYKMIDSITAHNPGALIIIMGDHGFRTHRGKQLYQPSRYNILCEVRFAAEAETDTIPFKSTVNLFRYIFNTTYAQNLPFLKDSAIVLRYQ